MSINQSFSCPELQQRFAAILQAAEWTSSQNPHMIPRKQPLPTRINAPEPILIHLLRLPNLSILRESQLVLLRHKPIPHGQTPQSHASIRWHDLLRCAIVLQSPAAHHFADHNTLLPSFRRILETDDRHAVVLQTSPPAVGAVGLRDLPTGDEAVVAVVADVVVAFVAGVAVEARVCGRDGVVADVAVLADGEGDVGAFGEMGHGDCAQVGLVALGGCAVVSYRE
jgi:hypothetical protein